MHGQEPMLVSDRIRNRADSLCSVMETLTGLDVRKETKKRAYVSARVMIAWVLLQDGCTESIVGGLLGRNHATVNHYRNKMKTFLEAPGYEAERELWEKFKKVI